MIKHTHSLLLPLALLVCTPQAHAQRLPAYLDDTQPLETRVEDALSRMTFAEKIAVIHAQGKFTSPGVKRLGIPDFWCDDGPHGVRADVLYDSWTQAGNTNDSVVAFPALTCLAATFNPHMAAIYGHALGEEALYRGKHMMLGPGVNIYRTPLGGRNFEYMGEDPYLASRIAVPYIQQLQALGVSACVKHFVLNDNEADRHTTNVIVSDRALHEIYLPAFKAAVCEAHTWGLMGAYNLYRGYHNCHNPYLLTDLLKGQWHYDGVVVSDWGGAHNTEQAAKYGLDMEFGTHTDGLSVDAPNAYDKYYLANPYRDLIVSGKMTDKELNDKVRRVLRLFFRTSMNRHRGFGSLCSEAHYATAEQIAEEGIVLLKNEDHILPLRPSHVKRLLIVGENALRLMTPSGGSSKLKAQREIYPLQAMRRRLGSEMQIDFARGYLGVIEKRGETEAFLEGKDEKRPAAQLVSEAVDKARKADVVVIFGGLNKNKHQDTEGSDRESYSLPYGQDSLVNELVKVNPNVVFVNISGNSSAMPWAKKVKAIIQGWYLGSQAGEALTRVIAGDVNPSCKLPYTWYAQLNDYPAHALHAYPGVKTQDGKQVNEEYKEGIYVGYRWADAHKVKPLFAFGHGLSYTTFRLSKLQADKTALTAADSITFSLDVTNTGKQAGAEVVQLYIHDVKSSVDRPYKELKSFRKVYLQPRETRRISLTIGRDALSYYDPTIQDWKAEPGKFEALIGTASDEISSRVAFTLK